MRIAAVVVFLISAPACVFSGDGEPCPYEDGARQSMYAWGNGVGHRLRDEVQPRTRFKIEGDGETFEEYYSVGDDDITDHLLGYSDGYFQGVINEKFAKTGGISEYPDNAAYTRGFNAGRGDGQDSTEGYSKIEKVVFAEGFADSWIDDKDLCD